MTLEWPTNLCRLLSPIFPISPPIIHPYQVSLLFLQMGESSSIKTLPWNSLCLGHSFPCHSTHLNDSLLTFCSSKYDLISVIFLTILFIISLFPLNILLFSISLTFSLQRISFFSLIIYVLSLPHQYFTYYESGSLAGSLIFCHYKPFSV